MATWSESCGGHFPATFFASSRPPQSQNQSSGENKKGRIMHPLIKLKKATPIFLVVLGCFALSSQAFGQSAIPTFSPANWSGCQQWINVKISTTMSGANVRVCVIGNGRATNAVIANNGSIPVGPLGTLTIAAQAFNSNIESGWGYSTYRCDCPGSQQYCLR